MRNVSKIVKEYRLKKEMPVSMLAFKLDVATSYIYAIESRVVSPPKEKLKALCKTLGIPKDKMKRAMIKDFELKIEDYI